MDALERDVKRALVFVEGSERSKDVVREAGELAAGVGADLLLVHVTTEERFEETHDALTQVHDLDAEYGVVDARGGAKKFAEDIGTTVFGDDGPEFEAIGAIGDTAEQILEVAERRDCDHVFVPGRERSPAGKAIFGDTAQKVILEFDGPVTVTTGGDVEA